MITKKSLFRLTALATVSSLTMGSAEAQSSEPPPPAQPQAPAAAGSDTAAAYGDIIVTAQKRSEKLSQTPMSITALSGDQLQARGIVDVAGLAKVTPGLSFVDSGAATPVYSLRGVGFFDQSIGARPTVSVYQSEVPLPFSIMSSGASLDVERVEVLKGPQGTLFGQNATGGAINYVAARPTSVPSGALTLGYGRFNDVEGEGFLNGPIAQDVNGRIAFRAEHSDGWQKSYTRDDTLGSTRKVEGRATIAATPASGLSLSLSANGFIDRSDTQAAQLIGIIYNTPSQAARVPLLTNYPTAPHNDRAADWNDPGFPLRRDNKFYQVSLRGDYDLADRLVLTSLTAYSHIKVRQGLDYDGTAINAISTDNSGSASSFYQELRLSGTRGPATFVVGGNYARDKSAQLDMFNIPYVTTTFGLPTGPFYGTYIDSKQQFRTKAAFGNVDLKLGSQFTLHAGGRYTKEDLDFQACSRAIDPVTSATLVGFLNILRARNGQTPLGPVAVGQCISTDATLTPALATGELNEGSFSWRVGLDWKPDSQTLVYANVSRGYKGGSGPTVTALSNAQFQPVTQESVTAYEVGFKVSGFRGAVGLSGAAFYYDYSDKQLKSRILTTPNVFGPLEALVNVPKSRILGAEFNLNAQPIRGLTMNLGGTYIDSKVRGAFTGYSITGVLADFGGEAFPYTPKYQLVGDTQYKWNLSPDLSAFIGGGFNYRSSTSAGFGNIDILKINAYTTVDLRAGLTKGRLSASVYGNNVFNTYYWTNIAKINDVVRRITGRPATYGVRVGFKF